MQSFIFQRRRQRVSRQSKMVHTDVDVASRFQAQRGDLVKITLLGPLRQISSLKRRCAGLIHGTIANE